VQGVYGPNVAVNVIVTDEPTAIEDPARNVATGMKVGLEGDSEPLEFMVGTQIAGAHVKLVFEIE